MNELASVIESVLFVSPKALKTKELAKLLDKDETEIKVALQALAEARTEQGIVLLESNDEWQLATNPKNSEIVHAFLNMELREKLTDATVETLAIIAYRQPISRTEIEAIRGVSSQYSIRSLLVRGLIQKVQNPQDSRQILYETTIEFLNHMGISSLKELPDFQEIVSKIKLPKTEVSAQIETDAETLMETPENIDDTETPTIVETSETLEIPPAQENL
jgi:segregation and condensation protein B